MISRRAAADRHRVFASMFIVQVFPSRIPRGTSYDPSRDAQRKRGFAALRESREVNRGGLRSAPDGRANDLTVPSPASTDASAGTAAPTGCVAQEVRKRQALAATHPVMVEAGRAAKGGNAAGARVS
jgi:hypothetical protein